MSANSLRPLAGPYAEFEKWMLEAVIADLNRGGIYWQLVAVGNDRVEIHRSDIGWRGDAIDIEAEAQEVAP